MFEKNLLQKQHENSKTHTHTKEAHEDKHILKEKKKKSENA